MGFRWFSLAVFGGCEQVVGHSPDKVRVRLALSDILVTRVNSILLAVFYLVGFSALAVVKNSPKGRVAGREFWAVFSVSYPYFGRERKINRAIQSRLRAKLGSLSSFYRST